MLQLRDYQTFACISVWDYFRNKTGNPLVAMPTGTGKSVVIAALLQGILQMYPTQKIMCLTHVKELIEQNYNKMLALWPTAPAGMYSAGLNQRDTMQPIIFGGIGSVAKRAHEFGRVDLLFIDECHLVSPNEETLYQKFIGALKQRNPYLKVVGFTATAWRLGTGRIVGEEHLFTDVCCDMTTVEAFNWFFSEGYLAPLIPKRTQEQIKLDGVHMRGGEFVSKELQNAVDKADITKRALEEAIAIGESENRKSWMVFCAGVEHAINARDMLVDMGVPCGCVHSKMTTAQRDEEIAKYKAGIYRAMTNNNVLTTGFDHPPMDLIIMLRPTASSVLWVQMLGRGTRPDYAPGYDLTTREGRLAAIAASGKQNCLVLDFGANTRRLGPINDPVIPSKKGEKIGEAPVKECPHCNTYNHASVRHCFVCGAEFTFQTKLKQAASTDELIKGGELPIIETFKVDMITYSPHIKVDRPGMVKVTYYCGLRSFTEFVCPEHTNYAGVKAREWWRSRTTLPMPTTATEFLSQAEMVKAPTHIRVQINTRYPTVLAACFDGSAFNTQPKDTEDAPNVSVTSNTVMNGVQFNLPVKVATPYLNDDIPF